MKIKYKIFKDRKLIVARFMGEIEYKDVVQWFDDTRQHADFSISFPGVVDLRKAKFGKMPSDKMRESTYALSEYMQRIGFTIAKWAILADAPMETCLMMLYCKDASRQHPIAIFSTIEAAEDYLGVPFADIIQE